MSLEVNCQGVSLTDVNILQEVIVQLNKDLSMSGISFEFETGLSKEQFIEAIQHWVEKLLLGNESILYNFLYRVDVDQNKIYSNDGKPQDNLMLLILNRELQKVVLKRKYSSGSNQLLT